MSRGRKGCAVVRNRTAFAEAGAVDKARRQQVNGHLGSGESYSKSEMTPDERKSQVAYAMLL
jgi:hypothetical protein